MDKKISLDGFRALPKAKKLEYANLYYGSTCKFKEGNFDFSYNSFMSDCEKLGFRQIIIDPTSTTDETYTIILSHGRREDVVEKKYTLDRKTIAEIDALCDGMSISEKSKTINFILNDTFTNLNKLKESKKVNVEYITKTENRIL